MNRIIIILLFLATSFCTAQTGIWTELLPTNSPAFRYELGMAEIGDGKMIIFGGFDGKDYMFDETWIFNYYKNNWTRINVDYHPTERLAQSMTRITKNKVLMFGGDSNGYYKNDTWIFDLETMMWSEILPTNKPSARRSFGMSQLMDGKVILVGGDTVIANYANDTWVFDIDSNNWFKMPIGVYAPKPPTCEAGMIAMLDTGKILFYGGWHFALLDQTWLYDYYKNEWKRIKTSKTPIPIAQSSMVNISKDKVIFWGGDAGAGSYFNYDSLWLFNLKDTSWQKINTAVTPVGRALHNLIKLNQDSIILYGGANTMVSIKELGTNPWLLIMNEGVNVFDRESNEQTFQSIVIYDKCKDFIIEDEMTSLKLFDSQGQLIKETKSQSGQHSKISFNDISDSLYIALLYKNERIKITKFLLVSNW